MELSGDIPAAAPDRLAWCLIILLLFAPPALCAYLAQYVWDRDPFVYAQLAKEVLAGRRLYSEAWQDKPPLAVCAYMVPQLIAPLSYRALSVFGGLCVAATALLYAVAFRRSVQAMLATAAFVALFGMTRWDRYAWPSTEIFSNIFAAGALLLGLSIHRHRRFSLALCLMIGILGCLAFHIRQNTVLCVLVPVASICQVDATTSRKLRALLVMFCGGIVACGLMLAFVAWCGDVPMYFWTVFVYPRSFASAGSFADLVNLWEFGWQGAIPFVFTLSACLAINERRDFYFVAACVAAAFVAVCSPMRYHTHYWGCAFPYIALLMGMAVERISNRSPQISWALGGMIAFAVVPAVATQSYLARTAHTFEEFRELAELADRTAPSNATLFVCGDMGCEAIQFASRLPPANTYEWTFQLLPGWATILPLPPEEIVAQYLASPPDVIVAMREAVAMANGKDPSDLTYDLQLLRALISEHQYAVAAEKSGYIIALRSRGG